MPPENENFQGMPRAELENQFKNVTESIREMNDLLKKINERQQNHYNDLIKVEKDVEFITKEIGVAKDLHKEEIRTLWNELRRRDKKSMWIIGMIVPVVTVIISLLLGLIPK